MRKLAPAHKGTRVTATITHDQNRLLRSLAGKHKISVGWLVRHAIDRMLSDRNTIKLPANGRRKT